MAILFAVIVYGAKYGIALPPLSSSINGSYLYEGAELQGVHGLNWLRLDVRGDRATLSGPHGLTGSGKLERVGGTVRIVGGQLYQDGYAVPTMSKSKVDLLKIVDDGQALYWEEAELKLVKQ